MPVHSISCDIRGTILYVVVFVPSHAIFVMVFFRLPVSPGMVTAKLKSPKNM